MAIESELAASADLSGIHYAQCWEDADILLEALNVQEGDVCVSIASGGDNSLSLLTKNPAKVIALDLSSPQIACLEIRVASYKILSHPELLELLGALPSTRRLALYATLRNQLSPGARSFWDKHTASIARGVAKAGKFENYFRVFRRYVLPVIHGKECVQSLFAPRPLEDRRRFYEQKWSNRRWKLLTRLFCSRMVLAMLGRDPRFFKYVEGGIADRLMARTRYALTELDPATNPYLQMIVFGHSAGALPHAWRPEHFESIRRNLNRLEWQIRPVEAYLSEARDGTVDRFNMSDVFEYISESSFIRVLHTLVRVGRKGGRMAYWNMLVPRRRPESLASKLCPLSDLAQELYRRDKAFFYSAFVVEEIQ